MAQPSHKQAAACPPFDSPAADFVPWVESLPHSSTGTRALLELLEESHRLYAGRSAYQVVWLRGYILLALAKRGLPPASWPFIQEELQNGRDAYLVAAAAFAVRMMKDPPPATGGLLVRALLNIRLRDDAVCLTTWQGRPSPGTGTTAVRQILESLRWLGKFAGDAPEKLAEILADNRLGLPEALTGELRDIMHALRRSGSGGNPCCSGEVMSGSFLRRIKAALPADPLAGLEIEDQDGCRLDCAAWFQDMPSVVAFFYTRCDNPDKCSLTVSKLAGLQKILELRGLTDQVKLAAFTYDPGFDLPARIRAYGLNRGFQFGGNARFFRSPGGIERLQAAFSLGVNFVGTMVNRHRIELFLVDRRSQVCGAFDRLEWDQQEVADELAALLSAPAGADRSSPARRGASLPRRLGAGFLSALAPLGMALFPKCPFCLAGYLSILGISSTNEVLQATWLRAVLIVLMTVQLIWIARRGYSAAEYRPLLLAFTGVAAVLSGYYFALSGLVTFSGVGAIIIASAWAARSGVQAVLAQEASQKTAIP